MKREQVDLTESSIYGKEDDSDGDRAAEIDLDRLESITGSADDPTIVEGELGEQFDALAATTDEEVDALQVNLLQDEALSPSRDGSGIIVDDIAEERIGKLTETGPYEGNQGSVSVSPGSDDTSSILRRHLSNTQVSRADAVVEDNVDQTQDETKSESTADEVTGA
jgi:hypothetical protein